MAAAGGIFALLTFVHFAVDWILQSHDEAMRKHNQWRVRARHCAVYTAPFAAVLAVAVRSGRILPPTALLLSSLLFLSHFVEDTYVPVLLWAKWVRKPPEMRWRVVREGERTVLVGPEIHLSRLAELPPTEARLWRAELCNQAAEGALSLRETQRELDRRGFLEFVSGPLGKILMIAVDQIVHIAFLLPVAFALA